MCLIIWTKIEEKEEISNFIFQQRFHPSVIIILYIVPPDHPNYYDFPINLLRNICIRNIVTSHFLILDFDMWPTPTLHDRILSIPREIIKKKRNAFIVPPVFLNERAISRQCKKFDACFQLLFLSNIFNNRSRHVSPSNITELKNCYDKKYCSFEKNFSPYHVHISFFISLLDVYASIMV
jgi:hypothetical protein